MLLSHSRGELNKALHIKCTEYSESSLAKSKPCLTLIHRHLLLITNYSRHEENGFRAVCQFVL